jgi:hypothetical protein
MKSDPVKMPADQKELGPPWVPSPGGLSGPLAVAAINALSAHIAILDEAGTISAVNDAWRRTDRCMKSNRSASG